jgi:hypothetical protein
MVCSLEDAKKNESLWILKNKTMYPGGYNLVHGSTAGNVESDCAKLSSEFTTSLKFNDYDHERRVFTWVCSDLHLEMTGDRTAGYNGDDSVNWQSVKSKRLVENEVLDDKIKRAKLLGDEELVTELKKKFLEA